MTRDHSAEVHVLETAADTLAAHPEWKPPVVLAFLRKYADGLREHTHEPA